MFTKEEKQKLKEAWSGLNSTAFDALNEVQQQTHMDKLNKVIKKLVRTSPDSFRGSVVKDYLT